MITFYKWIGLTQLLLIRLEFGIVIEWGAPVYHFETPRPLISPLTLYGHASCKIP